MKKIFLLIKLIFLAFILFSSILVISLWNINSDLPDSNISDYFPNEITKIYDTNYDLLYHVGTKDRFYLDYKKIPETMIEAIISAEDKNYFTHQGYDVRGILRAAIVNIKNIIFQESNSYVGASTITQQLVKNILLSNEKTIIRKIKEVILSIRIENKYSKEYILELYLNEIYFGRRSYGVATASSNYFNKSIYDLTIDEFAYLASLPKGPNNYDPNKNYKKAFERRNYVLYQMYLNKFITLDNFNFYSNKKIIVSSHDIKKYSKDYDTDFIINEVKKINHNKSQAFYAQSTIDPFIQKISEKSLIDSLALLEKKYRDWEGGFLKPLSEINKDYLSHWIEAKVIEINPEFIKVLSNNKIINLDLNINKYGPKKISPIKFLNEGEYIYLSLINDKYYLVQPIVINGSMVVINPFNGNILSLVGGTSYSESNFNRATQAFRQPGSSIKPFIYALALNKKKFFPNTMILDSQITLSQGVNLPIWVPKNYSNKSYGEITFRRALETSNNLVTLKIGLDIGLNQVNSFFQKIGLYESDNKEIYSLLLGSVEQNLITLVSNYSIFINGGYKVKPNIIKKIVNDDGFSIDNSSFYNCSNCSFDNKSRSYRKPEIKNNRERVLDELTAFQILNILEGAIIRGTGKSLKEINYPIAGKTGTTNDSKDLWFFGLTPEMVVGIYVGYDKPKKIGYKETGSSVALPVFKKFIKSYLNSNKVDLRAEFNIPQGVIKKYVDINDGSIFNKYNSNLIEDYFTQEQLTIIDKNDIQGIN